MSRSKLIAVAFYLGAVVVGAAVGIAADRTFVREWLNGRAQDQGKMRQTFAEQLSLTPAQQAAMVSIFGAARRADSVLMAPSRVRADSIFKAARAEFRLQLTPEQVKTYDEMRARRQRPNDGRR